MADVQPLTGAEAPATVPTDVLDSREAGGRALRGGLLRTGAFTASLLLGLITAPLLVRHLGDAAFGRYSSVLAVIAIVTGLTEGGINTVATRRLSTAADREERDGIIRDLLGLRLVLSVTGVALAVGFSAVAGYGQTLVLGTLVAGVGMLLTLNQTLLSSVLQVQLRFGTTAALELTRGVITAVLIVVLVLSDAGVLAFLAVVVPAAAVDLALTAWIVRPSTAMRPRLAPRHWRPLLGETAAFSVAIAVNSLYFRLTLVVMSLVASEADTGEFAISFRVMEVLVVMPMLLIGAAFPIISRAATHDRARFETASGRLFELSLLAGTLVSLGLTLGAPFVIQVLTGSSDHPATDVLRVQSLAMIASFVASAAGFALLGLQRTREVLIANVASLAVVLVLALVLAPAFGAEGGAVAALSADAMLATASVALLVRAGGPPLPLQAVPLFLLAAAAGYVVARVTGLHPLLQIAIGEAVCVAFVAGFGRFPPEVRELLRGRAAA